MIDVDDLWERYRRERIHGTCAWTTSPGEYDKWRNSDDTRLLVLTGEQGCGKSIALSRIVDTLLEDTKGFRPSSEPTTLVCSYSCEQAEATYNNAVCTTRTLLFQSFTQRRSLVTCAIKIGKAYGGCHNLAFTRLWEIMLAVIDTMRFGRIYLVLDAIDKYETISRKDLLNSLVKIEGRKNVKVVMACRNTNYDQLRLSNRSIRLDVTKACQQDLELIVSKRIAQTQDIDYLTSDEQQRLGRKIIDKSDKCALWATIVLSRIQHSSSRKLKDLEAIVDEVPPELEESYLHALRLIKPSESQLAARALHVLLATSRQMNLREFRRALFVTEDDTNTTSLEVQCQPEEYFPYYLRRLLGPLVRLDSHGIELLHHSLGDYLTNLSSQAQTSPICSNEEIVRVTETFACTLEQAHGVVAQACVTYLLLEESLDLEEIPSLNELDFAMPFADGEDEVGSTTASPVTPKFGGGNTNLPFFAYAADYWATHLSSAHCPVDHPLNRKALQLCQKNLGGRNRWAEHYRLRAEIVRGFVPFPLEYAISPLVIASYFGLTSLVQLLCRDYHQEWKSGWKPALVWAARMNQAATLSILVQDPLKDSKEVKQHALPDALREASEEALLEAALKGSLEALKILLSEAQGLNVNWASASGHTAVSWAVSNNHFEMVKLLMADPRVYKVSMQQLALSLNLLPSVFTRHIADPALAMLECLLLDSRVDLSARSKRGRTILSHAAENNHIEAVNQIILPRGGRTEQLKALLDDPGDEDGKTPFFYASWHGHISIIQALCHAGDMRTQMRVRAKEGVTTITAAARNGKFETLKVLAALDPTGLDTLTDNGRTPLSITALADDERGAQVAEVLLSLGAADTIERESETGTTALQYAVRGARFRLVETLVRKGGANLDNVIQKNKDGMVKVLVTPSAEWDEPRMTRLLHSLAGIDLASSPTVAGLQE